MIMCGIPLSYSSIFSTYLIILFPFLKKKRFGTFITVILWSFIILLKLSKSGKNLIFMKILLKESFFTGIANYKGIISVF